MPDLPFVGRDRSGGHNDTATTVFVRLIGGHGIGAVADCIKCPDQVHLDRADKFSEIMHAVFAQQFFGDPDSGGRNQNMQAAVCFHRRLNGGGDLGIIGHVCLHELDAGAKLLRQFVAAFFVDVGDDNPGAVVPPACGPWLRPVLMRLR